MTDDPVYTWAEIDDALARAGAREPVRCEILMDLKQSAAEHAAAPRVEPVARVEVYSNARLAAAEHERDVAQISLAAAEARIAVLHAATVRLVEQYAFSGCDEEGGLESDCDCDVHELWREIEAVLQRTKPR